MKTTSIGGWCCAALLLATLLAAGGCGGAPQAGLRGVGEDEAEELNARQAAAAQEPAGETAPEASDPASLERHGDQLAMGGDTMAALFQYNRAMTAAQPEQAARLRGKMALLYLRGGNHVQAERLYQALTEADPDDAQAWQGLGLALLAQGRLDEAQKALERAVDLDAGLWKAHNGLGVACNRQARPAQALGRFDTAIALQPSAAALHNNRGLALMALGRLDEAREAFQRALRQAPNNVQARNNLALVYFRQDRPEEALVLFEMTMGPAKARNNLGCLYARQGQNRQAADMFRQALEISPTYYKLAAEHFAEVRRKDNGVPDQGPLDAAEAGDEIVTEEASTGDPADPIEMK